MVSLQGMSVPQQRETQRKTRLLFCLAAVFFLFVFSPLFSSSCHTTVFYDSHSCQEHTVHSTAPASQEILKGVVFPNRFDSTTMFFLGVFVFGWYAFYTLPKQPPKLSTHAVSQNRIRQWIWKKSRPFVSSRNFIPHFAAMRDA